MPTTYVPFAVTYVYSQNKIIGENGPPGLASAYICCSRARALLIVHHKKLCHLFLPYHIFGPKKPDLELAHKICCWSGNMTQPLFQYPLKEIRVKSQATMNRIGSTMKTVLTKTSDLL
jgi:hypothetical protein